MTIDKDHPNTHGVTLPFGRHKGELLTRVPVSYLKWMLNSVTMAPEWRELAKSEFERRGDTMPVAEITGHAIDKASLRVLHLWDTLRGRREGLYSWLMRLTLDALKKGRKLPNGKTKYLGMLLLIEKGVEFPVLKTIMEARK